MIEYCALEKILEFSSNDLRAIINVLQLWQAGSRFVKTKDVKDRQKSLQKDSKKMLNFFDAVRVLFCYKDASLLSFADKMNYFYVDWSIMPLISHENYLHTYVNTDYQTLDRLAKCSEMMSFGDLISQ